MRIIKFSKNNKESGKSMVELAVSFVVLMILLAGVVDLGRMAFYYIAMRDSAQEGASYAAIFPHNNYEIFERIKSGAVDQSRIEVIVRYTDIAGNELYVCDTINNTNNCTQFVDSRKKDKDINANTAKLDDIVEITVRDPNFPITMPLIGAFIGNEITLETTIRDLIVRVPMEPTPTPNP